jgi:NAD-dependent deacetylase
MTTTDDNGEGQNNFRKAESQNSRRPIDADAKLNEAAKVMRQAQRIAVLTGAGISAESGLPTFSGAGGLWEGNRLEDVATPMAFRRDPSHVWRFYNSRRAALAAVHPNAGHFALVKLENRPGVDRFTLITQNVDGLHRVAGSRRVVELHGSLSRVRCTGCGEARERGHEPLPELPCCDYCGGLLRPDVVWFEEMLPADMWAEAENAAVNCQCLLVVGTSGVVYPAASLVDMARRTGASVIEVNVERTKADNEMDIHLLGPAGQILPRLLELL